MVDTQVRREPEEAARAAVVEATRLVAQQIQQQEEKEEEEEDDDDDDDGNMPMAQFLTPVAALDDSSIFYPAFGQNDFQLRADLISLFSNNLKFFGRNVPTIYAED
ncbi:Uncharacterized protein Adt_23636 [Abeliophyllum distichum]|uniref:Bromo domain-containing protein n=1 Tax=Abeliophyllum distichum TaxID=126358 RepID=A0ABD1SBP9_9LAMI